MQSEYEVEIKDAIRRSLSKGPKQLTEIIRDCRGAYPTTVQALTKELEPEIHLSCQPVWERGHSVTQDVIWNSYLAELEGNPVLSSWYFTSDTCDRIGRLRAWSEVNIAFLGTPRLFEWFSDHRLGAKRVLLDLDSVVLGALSTLAKDANDCIQQYDVGSPVSSIHAGQYDIVFLDPPWYFDEYNLWFRRAAQLAPRGVVFISLFPELLRPNARVERETVINNLREWTESLLLMSSFLEYEVPSFERSELKAAGFEDTQPWKLSDLVVAKVRSDLSDQGSSDRGSSAHWKEIDIGRLRVFVDTGHCANNSQTLLYSPAGERIVLSSPSRRNPLRACVNVLTSRGHGLASAMPIQLVQLLKNLSELSLHGNNLKAAIEQLPTDFETRRLLVRIVQED